MDDDTLLRAAIAEAKNASARTEQALGAAELMGQLLAQLARDVIRYAPSRSEAAVRAHAALRRFDYGRAQ